MRPIQPEKKIEENLKEAENRYRVLVDSVSEGILLVDSQGIIRFGNNKIKELFGYDFSEIQGKSIEILVPERFRESHILKREDFIKNEFKRTISSDLSLFSRRKDGTEFLSDISLNVIENLSNQKMVSVVIKDITQEKRVERHERLVSRMGAELSATLDMQERLKIGARLITESKVDWCSLYLLHEDHHLILFFRHFNHSIEKKERDGWGEGLISAMDRMLCKQVFDSKKEILLTHAELETYKTDIVDSGWFSSVTMHSAAYFPLTARDRVFGVIALFKEKEEIDYVDYRFAKIAVDRLSLSVDNAYLYQKSLKDTETREQLMAIVSHDLRNPISTINLGIQKLKRLTASHLSVEEMISQITKTTAIMDNSVKRGAELISDLLTFAKIESGTFDVIKKEINVDAVISEAIQVYVLPASDKHIALSSNVDPQLFINADHSKLFQVISNLIGNAMKFTPSGGTVQVSASPSSGGMVLFKISDTGEGIKKENLEKIFDRYWQPDRTHTQGAGLGLSIVKGIVEAHGGKVWAESEMGRGTTFLFTIPGGQSSSSSSISSLS